MEIIPLLPHFHATLNVITACLVTLAYVHIRRNERLMHRNYMFGALIVSAIFLVSYLTYHHYVGYQKFAGEGVVRPIYFTILASHIILAALIVPMLLTTVVLALRTRFTTHRRWARWTLPIWFYVSVSGIAVYIMAFHLFVPEPAIS